MKELEQWEKDYIEEMIRYDKEKTKKANAWKKKLKGLINVSGLFKDLSEMDGFEIIDIVEIYNVDEKRSGYSNHQHVRIKDDKDRLLYMKNNSSEIRNVDHVCVWQTVGMMGDDYSGFCLYPLKNGLYLKTSFSC